jgi:nucleoside-diphosphate-sugar epimerase
MLYPDGGDQWIDESMPPSRYPNAEGNLAAEASAARFSDAGGIGVVLRLGLFYGPGARHSEQFLALARRHVLPVLGHPDSYVSSIHVADGGAAAPFALQVPGGTYNVVDNEPLTKRQYAQALAYAAGKRPWIAGPGQLAAVFGDRLTSLTRSLRVSNRQFPPHRRLGTAISQRSRGMGCHCARSVRHSAVAGAQNAMPLPG